MSIFVMSDIHGCYDDFLSMLAKINFCKCSAIIRQMPYYHKLMLEDSTYIIVHAGYSENVENIGVHFDSMEQFYLYAREESCQLGGVLHGTIIAGHTPTIVKESFAYIFEKYNPEIEKLLGLRSGSGVFAIDRPFESYGDDCLAVIRYPDGRKQETILNVLLRYEEEKREYKRFNSPEFAQKREKLLDEIILSVNLKIHEMSYIYCMGEQSWQRLKKTGVRTGHRRSRL